MMAVYNIIQFKNQKSSSKIKSQIQKSSSSKNSNKKIPNSNYLKNPKINLKTFVNLVPSLCALWLKFKNQVQAKIPIKKFQLSENPKINFKTFVNLVPS